MKGRALLAAALLLAGCTVGPDYRRPELAVPPEFRGPAPEAPTTEASLGDLAWWQIFQDEALQGLVRTALVENYDLRVAAARVLEARAQVTVNRSFQFPDVSASASAPYVRITEERAPIQQEETFSPLGTLDLFWEVDLWGRLRRATEAARADLLASEDVQRFVVTTLVSDVATAYFQLRELDLELEISRRTLASRQDSLRLVQLRQQGGVAALIDVRQAEVLLYTAAQTIPDVERRIEQTENLISLLLGRNPNAVPRGRSLLQQLALPSIPAGLPSSLVERRPDIRQAEGQLAAATARIGVAKADYFPRVLLTGAAGGGGVMLNGEWFGPSGLFAIAPQVSLPIFNTGRIGAGVDSAEARAQQALIRYQQTVQQAFREVSDALVEHRKRQEFRVQQEALVISLRDAARLANIRYRGGVTSYLEVLDTERQLFDAELLLAQAQRDELLAIVRLYRALGGGWASS
ncbi:MAG TPA: efflux transporter outer membrane subunit [Methylomirabilota bacterium]|nr:efflux transporter outer membrane subunit [Methylomirabilota bacterium]